MNVFLGKLLSHANSFKNISDIRYFDIRYFIYIRFVIFGHFYISIFDAFGLSKFLNVLYSNLLII